jgi:hypothetical protein
MIFEIQKGWVDSKHVQEWTVSFPMVVIKPERVVSTGDHFEVHDQIVIQPIDHIIRKVISE